MKLAAVGWLGGAVIGAGLLLHCAIARANGPAVSEVNGVVDAGGGASNGTGLGWTSGSLSIPVGDRLGVQVDGALGKRQPRSVGGSGGHLFWRDPDVGLIGVTTERVWIGSTFFNRIGTEGEFYERGFTLAGAAGYQNGFVPHSSYTKLDLRLYPTQNLMIAPGVRQSGGRYLGRLGLEWQVGSLGSAGFALFAEAGAGTHGTGFVVAGLRLYFGAPKSLERRHREDDPPNSLADDLLENALFLHSPAAPGSGSSSSEGGGGGSPPPPPPPMF